MAQTRAYLPFEHSADTKEALSRLRDLSHLKRRIITPKEPEGRVPTFQSSLSDLFKVQRSLNHAAACLAEATANPLCVHGTYVHPDRRRRGIPNGHVQIKHMMTEGDTAFYINNDKTQVYLEADLRVSASYIANCRSKPDKWVTPPTGSRLKLQIADSEPRSSAASGIDADQHRRSDTPLTPRTAHTSEGSSSSSRSFAGPGSGLFEDSEDGGKVEVSDVRVPVSFASGMKLLFMSNDTCHADSLCNVLCDVVNMETRRRLMQVCNGEASNFNSLVHSAAVILRETVGVDLQTFKDAGSSNIQATHQRESPLFRLEFRFALLKNIVDAHLAAPIEDRYFLVAPVDDEDGCDHCVGVRAVKGGGVFLLDGDKSRVQVSASGASVRCAVPFASCLSHGYKEQVVFLRELRLSSVRSKRRRAKRKRASSPKPIFQHGL
jgi:hypothetical protein